MNQALLEKHENLVIEIAKLYLSNMESELGKKYQDHRYEINPNLSNGQSVELKSKYNISSDEFANLYAEFQNMTPTEHLEKAMGAFTASGGNVDIAPYYDEDSQKLNVTINFVIKGNTLDKIAGLSPIEDIILKMDAMLQVESIMSESDPNL